VHQRLTPHISSIGFLNAFLDAGGQLQDCFLMIDSGMGREGLLAPDVQTAHREFQLKGTFGGIATHLASADSHDNSSLRNQYSQFAADIHALKACGVIDDTTIVSINNSAGMLWNVTLPALINPILHRPGALIYGISPTSDFPAPTSPVLSWRARIHLIKSLPAGHAVGYGATYITERKQKIATVGVGYADGYPRRISPDASILIRGQFAKIVGVVSMDQLQVDITDIPDVAEGDWVTLIGSEGAVAITVTMLAAWADVPVQWPTSALSPRVPRRYSGLE
jgi:alanine racemase